MYSQQAQQIGYDVTNTSGQGANTSIPAEVQGLNWGAFFLGWIWSAFNGGGALWIIVGLFFSPIDRIFLLFKGNEISWKNKQWESVEAFKATQRKWVIAGLVIIVVAVVIGVLGSVIGAAAGTAANS
jgi:hypothetical protein